MARVLKHVQVTIPNGASLSNGVLVGDNVMCGILMPAAWDAANLTFQISFDDGATWNNLYDNGGNEITETPTAPAGKYLALDPSQYAGIAAVKIRSGTQGTPVNQTAARVLTVVSRKFYALD
jgi:hypothetical protein